MKILARACGHTHLNQLSIDDLVTWKEDMTRLAGVPYNAAVWPVQWILAALGLAAVLAVLRPQPWTGVAVSASLGFLWAWIALAYHLAFFTRISPAAFGFAVLSAAGAVVFIWQGVARRRLAFRWVPGLRATTGAVLVAFALVV